MPTALVTGATAGIGAAFVRRLAADGYDLVLVSRDAQRLEGVANDMKSAHGVTAEVLPADLSTEDGIAAVEKRVADTGRPVETIVNNAGFGFRGRFGEVPIADELAMLRVHCEAVLRVVYAALPGMRERGSGQIVSVSSVGAFFPRGTYGATKAWLVSFTQALRRDIEVPGIKVSVVCPGFTRTEFHERAGMRTSKIPGYLWLSPDKVAADALDAVRKGKVICVPGARWKVLVGLSRVLPRGTGGSYSSRAGRRD